MTSRIVLLTAMVALCASPAESQRSRHTYVIVHGAWGGGWDWRHVDSLLSASGNRVYRPTLTGLGERVHLASPTTDLSTHITDIVNVIRYEDLRDVVLVGHSYGGMVISGVADRIPDRIRRLVFIDAFVPEDGESVVTASRGTKIEPFARRMLDSAKNGVMAPFWVKSDTAAPTDAPQPERTFTEPLRLQNPASRRIAGTYILTVDPGKAEAEDDFAPFAQRAKARGWTYHLLRSDHVPERTAPRQLTALLRRIP